MVAAPIAQHRHLIAQLHHRGPDVVEELDLDDRLQPANRHADRPADDVGFRNRRVEHPVVAKRALETVGDLEDAALARHELQCLAAAGVGDVLAEDHDARVARHLVLEGPVDGGHHRVGLALGRRGRAEPIGGGIHVRREDEVRRSARGGAGRSQGLDRGFVDFALDFAVDRFDLGGGRQAVVAQELREPGDGVAPRFGFALLRRLV